MSTGSFRCEKVGHWHSEGEIIKDILVCGDIAGISAKVKQLQATKKDTFYVTFLESSWWVMPYMNCCLNRVHHSYSTECDVCVVIVFFF